MTMRTDLVTLPQPRAPRWVVNLLLVALVVGPALARFLPVDSRPHGVLLWTIALLPAAALLMRRRWPLAALGAVLTLFAVAALLGTILPGVGFATAIVVFHLANVTSRRRSLLIGGITIVLVGGISVLAAYLHQVDPMLVQLVVTVAFASAAGDATRSRREYLTAVTERAERAEQTRESEARRRVTEERLRIARDLHDAVAHQISVISLNAGVASSAMERDPERTRTALLTIRQASRTVLAEIGDLLSMLRTAEQEDIDAAPQYGLDHLDSLVQQFADGGLDVHQRIEGDTSRVVGAVAVVAYRVVQEALTNAHKHGADHRAHLLITVQNDDLRIVVGNPVAGPSTLTAATPVGTRLGILGLRERVASVRGTVEAGPAPGGWTVTATIPLPKEHPS